MLKLKDTSVSTKLSDNASSNANAKFHNLYGIFYRYINYLISNEIIDHLRETQAPRLTESKYVENSLSRNGNRFN